MRCHIKPKQIKHDLHAFNRVFIICVFNKIGHRRNVFRIIVVAVPFRKSIRKALLQPDVDALKRFFRMIFSAHSIVGENLVGPLAPGQVFANSKHHLMIFRPVTHTVAPGFIHPVFKAQKGVLYRLTAFIREIVFIIFI
ncbi:hypothetical protein SDC9_190798 [bioreactor metagenome]|uniref:Uncharacterized protein n=1 Tax=bioreactor metagenome TaxID=1076179 RepID=A0A645HYH6_9ZZZZ